jgi:hypothetical protein
MVQTQQVIRKKFGFPTVELSVLRCSLVYYVLLVQDAVDGSPRRCTDCVLECNEQRRRELAAFHSNPAPVFVDGVARPQHPGIQLRAGEFLVRCTAVHHVLGGHCQCSHDTRFVR